ncbi:Hypothetical protein NTJ_02737 [Nesidiocoris tenuis]|uniref:Uncharacterized protein n=1 Tax=Nesidiocoris tenuis TaxID=355587 RepID=A0ABN7ACD4_9HEMI|nr:Hypothetical protein NTJ_02737 [Nesidiocoris tenuis]
MKQSAQCEPDLSASPNAKANDGNRLMILTNVNELHDWQSTVISPECRNCVGLSPFESVFSWQLDVNSTR